MKDGIIKGDGTSRKMKATLPATYEEFKRAAEAGEQTLDVMFNAPGWQQQPTFLNKQNLGQDKTMAVYNRGPEGTVDDLFQSVFAVGDIKVSARTDLGDSWLLCNGDYILDTDYPELAPILPVKANKWEEKTLPFNFANIQAANDMFFAVDQNNGYSIMYSNSLNGPWKKATAPSGDIKGSNYYVFFFKNLGNIYAIVTGGSVYWAEESNLDEWTKNQNANHNYTLNGAVCSDSKIYANYAGRFIARLDDIKTGNWKDLTNFSSTSFTSMAYGMGKIIAGGSVGNGLLYFDDVDTADKVTPQYNAKFAASNVVFDNEKETWIFSGSMTLPDTRKWGIIAISDVLSTAEQATLLYELSGSSFTISIAGDFICGYTNINRTVLIDRRLYKVYGAIPRVGNIEVQYIVFNGTEYVDRYHNYVPVNNRPVSPYLPEITFTSAYAYIRGK